jgi:uncharacterized repeat protein (TIGR03803 family)
MAEVASMKHTKLRFHPVGLLIIVFSFWASSDMASASNYQVIYHFQGSTDGNQPYSVLTFDQAGNLYGTTKFGGDLSCPNDSTGCGTVFQLRPPKKHGDAWTKTSLYSFKGNDDGWYPAGVVTDRAGNVYGVTSDGTIECQDYGSCGTVFELQPPKKHGGAWVKNLLYRFRAFDDGGQPEGGLMFDASGNLYGTTCIGGSVGYGSVFELAPSKEPSQTWSKTELYSFDWNDGRCPPAGVVFNKSGDLYGVTSGGGSQDQGLVFQLAPPIKKGDSWKESVLVKFDGNNGRWPIGGLSFDAKGRLYGTTITGGSGGCANGLVFQLKPPTWKETQVYVFCDLGGPYAGVVVDGSGNLYGTTSNGGALQRGIVFQLKPPAGKGRKWSERTLHTFRDGGGGSGPTTVVLGKDRALYGSALFGGSNKCQFGNCGVIFRIVP